MQKTVYKWFWAWEFGKEEHWLAAMVRQGWVLAAVGFANYRFERCAPGEYTVRLELLEDLPGSPRSRDYIDFVESTGAEYLGGIVRWAYFRKKAEAGGFDLFSDMDSRIRHLERVLRLLVPVTLAATANLGVSVMNVKTLPGIPMLWACAGLALAFNCLLWRGVEKIWEQRKLLLEERTLHE